MLARLQGVPMRTLLHPLAAALWIVVAASASASPPCRDTGVAEVAQLAVDAEDDELAAGLGVSFLLALTPQSFPVENITSNAAPCSRGIFSVSGAQFEMFGDDRDSPPRWSVGQDPARIAFLALMPDPADALAWARARRTNPSAPAMFTGQKYYVLAVTDGSRRLLFALFNAIPTDTCLQAEMRSVLSGARAPLAIFDGQSRQTVINADQPVRTLCGALMS
jgi:hypothetical protein